MFDGRFHKFIWNIPAHQTKVWWTIQVFSLHCHSVTCGISKVPFWNSMQHILPIHPKCVFYSEVKVYEILDLRTHCKYLKPTIHIWWGNWTASPKFSWTLHLSEKIPKTSIKLKTIPPINSLWPSNTTWPELEIPGHRSVSPRPTNLEEDRKLFVDFSSILCLRFEIQAMRTYRYNFHDWVSNTAHGCIDLGQHWLR